MPQRHSRNNTDAALFTYHERKEAGYGTQKLRYGADSQLPFGHCCLTLKPVEDPVVTPSGHVYSREAIMEYLLTKTQELKRQRALYEAQQEEATRAATEEDKAKMVAAQRFIEKEKVVGASGLGGFKGKSDGKSTEEEKSRIETAMLTKVDQSSREERKADLKRTSFWLPEFAPEVKKDTVDLPDKRPRSPMSGRPLRVKDLIPVTFMEDPDKSHDKVDGKGKYICAVSRKQITSQQVVLIKKTGVVMLETVAQELAYPDMTCPITGKKFKEDDVVRLKSAGTGFCASGEVEVKKHRATRF